MRKFPPLSGIVILLAVLLTIVFIACRKTDQKPVEQTAVEKTVTKNFFSVPAGTDNIVHAITEKIYRQNERKPFSEDLVKRVGYPNWGHSLIAERPGSTRPAAQKGNSMQKGQRVILYIPFAKETERKTKAVLRVVIDGADTAFQMLYPQQYINYGFKKTTDTEWEAEDLFSVFANFDYDLFGTTKYLVKDGRIFGKKKEDLVIVERHMTEKNNRSNDVASRLALISVCVSTTACVYASETAESEEPNCITKTNCTTYWYEDGTDTGGSTGGSGDGGGSTGGSGDGDGDDWPDDPCASDPLLVSRLEPTDPTDPGNPCGDEPWESLAQNFGKLCGTYQWTTIGSSWYTTLYTVGFSLVNTDGMLLNFVFSLPCVQIAKSRASTQTLANDAWNEAWNYEADKVLKDANTYGGPIDDFRVKQNMKTYIQSYLYQNYPGSTFNPAGCLGSVPISHAKYCP